MAIPTESLPAEIAPELRSHYQKLNIDQRKVVAHECGPMMVIACPGSGKTRCLILRAMNLLIREKALPQELVLCTYTKKAAFEMQDRLSKIAVEVAYRKDISLIRVGTIHSICERIITENLHRLPTSEGNRPSLGNDFQTLDEFSQRLFIFENLQVICGNRMPFFMNLWRTQWNIVKQLQKYFDKITDELIDIRKLASQQDYFLPNLAYAYKAYHSLLGQKNCVDFAFLEKIVYSLLINPEIAHFITKGIRYVLVDEYQDTNYVQEQILIKMAAETNNIFVVGDEDQSLYRFRGATVQNIRNFVNIFPDADRKRLKINYRSHPKIIEAYNRWMVSINWAGYRYDKKIQACPEKPYEAYPAVLSILGQDVVDEAQQVAELIFFLKETGKITDYNQVALLMYSVKAYWSDAYVQALQEKGILVFCPRAGTYFDQYEVRLMVGCLVRIFNYTGGLLHGTVGNFEIHQYVEDCLKILINTCDAYTALEVILEEYVTEIAQLTEGQTVNRCLTDYFYTLLAIEPFTTFLKDENKLQNLVIFSQLLETFQNHYHFEDISNANSEQLISCFVNRFLCLLHKDGMNQFEDPEQPFPHDHVLVMTIHQAKGLEFPVVIVGSLDNKLPDPEENDSRLRHFYRRQQAEPENRIPLFDFMRRYYVAFSRAKNLLVLTGNQRKRISPYLNEIMRGLPQWGYAQSDLLSIKTFEPAERSVPKPRYSFTSHIKIYETCPRQYQFFREYKFIPSRSADTFIGLLVHQTVERIHRIVLDGQLLTITQERLRELFEQTYYFLSQVNMCRVDERGKEKAYKQVENYFYNNQYEMYDLKNAEEHITIMKDKYILTGQVDIVMEHNGRREVWDLKTSNRPGPGSLSLEQYERQLYMYAYSLEKRDRVQSERLVLYWTEEPLKEDALMSFKYQPEKAEKYIDDFEKVVTNIQKKNFAITVLPEACICKKCDMRNLCIREGLIERC